MSPWGMLWGKGPLGNPLQALQEQQPPHCPLPPGQLGRSSSTTATCRGPKMSSEPGWQRCMLRLVSKLSPSCLR